LSEPSAYAARHLASDEMADVPRFAAAQKALDTLRHLNTEKARSGEQRAADLDLLANILGAGVGVMVLSISGMIVWWMRLQVFRPIMALGGVMGRFGRGDRAARADEVGPAELREMARRFNEMAAALAEQRDAQLAFLGGVAHDLRGPLFALRMSLAAVRPDLPLLPEQRLRRMFALIDRQTVQLERMVGDLLDSARIEAGQLELRLELSDGRALVREIAEPFEGSSRLRLELSLSEPLRCDPLRVQQVLSNLLSNACKYSLPGGEVEVRFERIADEALLAVTDHGIGMSAEDQRHLFEPFRRLGPSRGHIPGVGLGLSVVRRIVDAHGGRVEVESAPGRGSSFRVYLPLAGPTGPTAPTQ
jgi:signal transduction histidine kinase